ncbi:ankyrin repeat domain-containing protein [Cardinium endosymbiont of Encarsia pergandiella]|uniref:ankyrin repeat domain-containing protein n=1 Tax=Cardinium endosymbiont of Encarsia pergandiella TaxID=249402 RepID=UPI0004B2DED3|nr:ankyrin repeat domain-containing protein [Cardinium endosymbiont of Encarsia pergandiella]
MKTLNVHTKQRCFFIKSITVLSLSFILQGRSCRSGGGTMDYMVKKIDDKQFIKEIGNKKDISQEDEVGNNMLYAAVSNKELQKVVLVLKRIDEDIASKRDLEYNHKDFPNTYYNNSNKTALGLAIEKNYIEIVKRLAQSEHIDINKAKKGSTSLLEALLNKKKEIATILLNDPKTDIRTKDATSGSSPLHLAIEQKLEDIASLLITKLSDQDLKGKNKKGDTPLHLAIEHNLDDVVLSLVKKFSTIEDLCDKDKKGRTPLHMAVRGTDTNAFQIVFHRIEHLCNDKSTSIGKLFEKDTKGRSVFARAYLPKYDTQRRVRIFEENMKPFASILSTVHNNLTTTDWESIANEINSLEQKRTINEGYRAKLLKIVDRYKPLQNAIGA